MTCRRRKKKCDENRPECKWRQNQIVILDTVWTLMIPQATTVCGVDLSAQVINNEAIGPKQNRSTLQFLFSPRPSTKTLRTLNRRHMHRILGTLDENLYQGIVAKLYG